MFVIFVQPNKKYFHSSEMKTCLNSVYRINYKSITVIVKRIYFMFGNMISL